MRGTRAFDSRYRHHMRKRAWLVGLVVIAACEKKKAPEPKLEGPMPVRFGDCAAANLAFVSGPRPAPFTPEQASGDWSKVAEEEAQGAAGAQVATDEPPPPAAPRPEPKPLTDEERKQAIEAARAAGVLGSTTLVEGGAFASLTGTGDLGDTGDVSSGFDDTNIYGGLLGNEAGEMNGGFGFGRSGFGPGGGGTGWGTIGTGRYGSIGRGSGTGSGYGVGGGRGMRGRSSRVPTVSIGQPNAQGDLDKAIIRRYIKRNIAKITYCYEKQLLVTPRLSGTVMTQFFITPRGEVATAKADGMNADVASCVAGVIKAIVFPKPKGGGGVQVNYPFTFRPSGDDTTAAAGSGSDANAGSADSAGSVPPAAPEPAAPERKLFRPVDAPKATSAYEPGAENPLRGQAKEIEACLRKGSARSGAAVIELAYAGGKTTGANVFGIADTAVEKCLAEVAKRVAPAATTKPAATLQRCSLAFGEGMVDALPAVVITSDAIMFGGPTIMTPEAAMKEEQRGRIPALAEAIQQRVTATTSGKAPLTVHGPVAIRAIDTTPMKVVTRVVASVLGGGDDFVLATQSGAAWSLVEPMALPVVPVPFGTGARWGRIKVRSSAWGFGDTEERVGLSILVAKDVITVGKSRINEFQTIPRDGNAQKKLGEVLAAIKADKLFAGRTDIEIAAADEVLYSDYVATVRTAIGKGFTDWMLAEPGSLSARPTE
jgi:hypothetical protein